MKTYLFEGVVTALSSISHGGDTIGITKKLRREHVLNNGVIELVPIISGNAIRGLLRDIGMRHMLRELGYKEGSEEQSLSLAAFYFLFSGGTLSKVKKKGIDISEARKWRELIPLVSLFGGAMGNQIMQGKLKIGKMIPVCVETSSILPSNFLHENMKSAWDLTQEESFTRTDDEKNENLRALISPQIRELLADAAEDRAKKATTAVVATGQHQQMRYHIETFIPGTIFAWEIVLENATVLEFEALITTLVEFGKLPYIGGKSATGHGKVKIKFDSWVEINPNIPHQEKGSKVGLPIGKMYQQHLRERRDDIMELINGFL